MKPVYLQHAYKSDPALYSLTYAVGATDRHVWRADGGLRVEAAGRVGDYELHATFHRTSRGWKLDIRPPRFLGMAKVEFEGDALGRLKVWDGEFDRFIQLTMDNNGTLWTPVFGVKGDEVEYVSGVATTVRVIRPVHDIRLTLACEAAYHAACKQSKLRESPHWDLGRDFSADPTPDLAAALCFVQSMVPSELVRTGWHNGWVGPCAVYGDRLFQVPVFLWPNRDGDPPEVWAEKMKMGIHVALRKVHEFIRPMSRAERIAHMERWKEKNSQWVWVWEEEIMRVDWDAELERLKASKG